MGYGDYLIRPGLGNVGSYQIPGTPFLTGGFLSGAGPANNSGEVRIDFPSVCSFIEINNNDVQPILVHFDSRSNPDIGARHHYHTVEGNAYTSGTPVVINRVEHHSQTFNIRTTGIYISLSGAFATGSFEMYANLTSIEAKEMKFPLSGSGINTL